MSKEIRREAHLFNYIKTNVMLNYLRIIRDQTSLPFDETMREGNTEQTQTRKSNKKSIWFYDKIINH